MSKVDDVSEASSHVGPVFFRFSSKGDGEDKPCHRACRAVRITGSACLDLAYGPAEGPTSSGKALGRGTWPAVFSWSGSRREVTGCLDERFDIFKPTSSPRTVRGCWPAVEKSSLLIRQEEPPVLYVHAFVLHIKHRSSEASFWPFRLMSF